MDTISSIQKVERKFNTGDEPVLVDCEDGLQHLCKYSRTPGSPANKLICELIGARMLEQWNLDAPQYGLVNIKKEHVPDGMPCMWFDNKCFGTTIIDNTIDVSMKNIDIIPQSPANETRLLRIGLYDLWIANEDRSNNNSNLIYDYSSDRIIPIDNGGIFNTVNISNPIYLLDTCDSILSSEMFSRLRTGTTIQTATRQEDYFNNCLLRCEKGVPEIIAGIPEDWNMDARLVKRKLSELFSSEWKNEVWNKFLNILKQTSL